MVENVASEPGLFPQSVGDRLRAARELAKMDLNDVAARTRIPLRHLEAMENGDHAALPSPTYSLGFTKSYARAVGADDVALVRDLRTELGRDPPESRVQAYEPADPSRVPPRILAWATAAIALLLAIGYVVWRDRALDGNIATPAPAVVAQPSPAAAPPSAAPVLPTTGQVVLTASAPTWIRITDTRGARLLERELAAGERYEVPGDALDPQLQTGRPEALSVTVAGRPVAALGPPATTVKVGISAAALAARASQAVTPGA